MNIRDYYEEDYLCIARDRIAEYHDSPRILSRDRLLNFWLIKRLLAC